MKSQIRILILEDEQFDIELIERQLKEEGLNFKSVTVGNRSDFIYKLEEFKPEVILADYKLPQFSGMDALEVVKQVCPEVPFIIVTGSISEDVAVECLKAGAWDYVIKERILRLGAAVKNALNLKKGKDLLAAAQKDLIAREELHRSIFETAADVIAIVDQNAVILDVNSSVKSLIGMSPAQVIGHSAFEFLQPESLPKATQILKNIIQNGTSYNKEFKLYKKDGQPVDLIINAVGIKKENDQFRQIVAIIHDMTSPRQIEQQIQKDEKLKSISVLASGIAHDFNNILTVILGNASLVKMLIKKDEKLQKYIKNIESAGIRARNLTQQLLTFAKGGVPDLKTGSIADLISESSAFMLTGSNVRSEISVASDLWPVEMDEGQINQVLNNLVLNAIQAMPDGGLLKLLASNISIAEDDFIMLRPGEYIKISIIDQGAGILPENINKIFDPFFTTKKGGSGLGLANAYTIVRNHRGLITVHSQVGVGTQFDLYLPATKLK
ncbi:MAG: ATP-binding protein [Candidatus Neomarinimicrobiota bacterium]